MHARTKLSGRAAPRLGLLATAMLVLALQGCGGGGGSPGTPVLGSGGSSSSSGGGSSDGTAGGLESPVPSASVAQQCAPGNELAPASRRTGTLESEKRWIRAYYDEDYLWREQVPARDPRLPAYNGPAQQALANYFYDLRTPERTASGAARDRFSFMIPETEWTQLMQGGVSLGYGLEWTQASRTAPRGLRVAYVEAGGTAAQAGLKRGDRVLAVNGISTDTNDEAQWRQVQAALYPQAAGTAPEFRIQPREGGAEQTLRLSAATQRLTPVPQAKVLSAADGARVGYLVFHDHNLPAETQLAAALRDFAAQGVSDLVLDMRYNGGGYLFIAAQLAYMVAGPGPTAGRVFESLRHNSRRQSENEDSPFRNQSCQPDASFRCTQQQTLPALNLRRLYVLTQPGTCSASESLINGLRGVDVEVVLVGGRTCGKPYGFSGRENCGNRYLAIEFEGVNAKGFGDYADGFAPSCEQPDDLSRDLGDPQEGLLAAALAHRQSGQCPAARSAKALAAAPGAEAAALAAGLRKPWPRENRLLGRP